MNDKNSTLKAAAGTVGGQQLLINLMDNDIERTPLNVEEPQRSVITCTCDPSRFMGHSVTVIGFLTLLLLAANDLIVVFILGDNEAKIAIATLLLFLRLIGAAAFAGCTGIDAAQIKKDYPIYTDGCVAFNYSIVLINTAITAFWYTYCTYIVIDQMFDGITITYAMWMLVVGNNVLIIAIYVKLLRPLWYIS